MCEMEKMLVTSIFSFSHNVFKRFLSQGGYESGLYGKVLTSGTGEPNYQQINREFFFSVKDRNLFHRVDNIFTSGAANSENITGGVHEMK